MSAKLRIGVVGLGGIAQKAWLPVLGAADGWTLQAAWSPGKEKALRICETWRIPYADSLEQLAAQCRGLVRLVLVGSSFGGLMATCHAIRAPEQCERLILLAPALNFAEFVPPPEKITIPTRIVIGRDDVVTPPALVLPIARRTFAAAEIDLVDDDHMLHRTFPALDWQAMLA